MKQLTDEQIEGCVRSAKVEGKGCLIPSVLAEHLARELERSNGIGEAKPWVGLTDEIALVLTDPDSKLSPGAIRALEYMQTLCEKNAGQPAADDKAVEPVFWYRPRSDGCYEGPIHNSAIERVRKLSGVWIPLYTTLPTPAVPEGYALVPVEPTEDMLWAGQEAIEAAKCRTSGAPAIAYRAMLSAAPKP